MANCRSALKRIRQNEKARLANKKRSSTLRTNEKKLVQKIEAKDLEGAQAQLSIVASGYDKAAKVGLIHANKANRKKSRLQKAVSAIAAG